MDIPDDSASIGLPFNFIKECEKYHNGKDIKDIVKKNKIKGVRYDQSGKLYITGKVMREFLMSQIKEIVDHVQTLRKTKECYGFDAIFLVGGFSACKLLQSAIEKAFGKVCDVVVPICPSLAIVEGSIKFGFNPTLISQKTAQYTYGISYPRKFQPGDKEEYKFKTSEGELYCSNIFKEIVRKSTPITKENYLHISRYVPIEKDQKGMSISIFKSSKADIKYATGEGVEKVGTLYVPMPGWGLDREVEVTVDLSGTEMLASVKNLMTNESSFIFIDFLCGEC